jgi:hypothetical protein
MPELNPGLMDNKWNKIDYTQSMAITRPPKNVGKPSQKPSGKNMVRNNNTMALMIVMAHAPLFFFVLLIRVQK